MPIASTPCHPIKSQVSSIFRCKAVVDWLKIRIKVSKRTNFMSVQAAITRILGTPTLVHVKAQDEGPGKAATIFDITIQDPNRLMELTTYIKLLEERFPFCAQPVIVKLELSVDFYSRRHSPADLSAMTERLMKEFAATGNNPRRYIHIDAGRGITEFLINDNVQWKPDSRQTMYVGNEDDEESWRIYLKRTDRNQTPITDSREHRARVEVTLSGKQLATYCTTLKSMADMRFERLSDKFRFREFVPPEVPLDLQGIPRVLADREAKRLRTAAQTGYVALWRSKRRKYSRHSRADTELNGMVRQALRNLTERFCAEKRGNLSRCNASLPSGNMAEHGAALITTDTTTPSNLTKEPSLLPLDTVQSGVVGSIDLTSSFGVIEAGSPIS